MNLLGIFLYHSRRRLGVATTAGIASGLCTTALIVVVNQMIGERGHCSPAIICVFGLLSVARLICGIASHALLVHLSQYALHDLRLELTHKITMAPLRQIERIGSGWLTTLFADDMLMVATAVINLLMS